MDKFETIFNSVIQSFEQSPDLDVKELISLKNNTNEEVVLKILARFSVTLRECIDSMSIGIESENLEPIWQAAHKIAGSAQLIGFKELGTESRDLYQEIKKINELSGKEEKKSAEFIHYAKFILSEIETNFPQLQSFL